MIASKRPKRLRLATILPFAAGVFLGTLITIFLVLTLRSIEEEGRGSESFYERAASMKMPSMPRIQEKNIGPTHSSDGSVAPPRKKELAHYNILVSTPELKTRGLAAHKTWASGLGNKVSFYLHPPGGNEEINFAYKRRMPLVSLGPPGRAGGPRAGATSPGAIRAWVDVCERQLGRYHWYAKVQDTTYLRHKELEKVLSSLNSSEAHFVGHQILPEGLEREELGLREGEGYCMEMGYVLSVRALQMLAQC